MVTASGRTAASARGLSEISRARPQAARLATISASIAVDRVFQAEVSSTGALFRIASPTWLGAGRI